MTNPLRLILFDVDGTLVDSQGSIVAAMKAAFDGAGLTVPARGDILSIVGLSLDHALTQLAPDQSQAEIAQMVQAYKDAYFEQRQAKGAATAPLYPGVAQVLKQLGSVPENLLGVATGKSQRGLDALLETHGLETTFATRQVADHHPSKPHPSMITTAMAETGVAPAETVMIGDTSFDMDMARAAGVAGIGVSWGYHATDKLGQVQAVVDRFADIPAALNNIWKTTQ